MHLSHYSKKRKALVDLIHQQTNKSNVPMLFVMGLTAWVIWLDYSPTLVISWLAAGCLLMIIRFIVLNIIVKRLPSKTVYFWREFFLATFLFLAGTYWGMTSWLFFDPALNMSFAFMTVVLVGLVPSAMPLLSGLLYMWLIYSVPLLLLTALKLYHVDLWQLSLLTIINLLGLIPISKNLGITIEKSITLDHKNAELLNTVSKAKERAEQSNLEKSQFMAATSHDLRQPLHVQGILLEALSVRLKKGSENHTLLKKAMHSNEALNMLFTSLLEVSQLDSGAIQSNISHHNVTALCQSVIDEYQMTAKKKGLLLALLGDEHIALTDTVLFARILRNLVSNALKFTSSGGVRISLSSDSAHIFVTITDTGIGIAPDQHQHIFNEYYQLGNKARDRTQGIGLGLALVKRLCSLLNHNITVESVVGEGSQFRLSLNIGDANQVATLQKESSFVPIENLQILLIDDEQDILDAMSIMLTDWNCHPHGFLSLESAIEFLDKTNLKPDLIISDYRLKEDLTGLEAIRQLQKKFSEPIPSLLVSGDTDPELLRSIHQQNFYMLHKPLKSAQLRKVIRIILKDNKT